MPQLDPVTFMPQLVWLAITFLFLYLMMSGIVLPRLSGVLEERRDRIADDLDKAAQLRNDAEAALAAYEKALADARSRAMAIAAETRERVKAETDKLKAESDARIAERLREAEARINAVKQEAMTHVHTIATEAASDIVAKLVGASLSEQTVGAAVREELSEEEAA